MKRVAAAILAFLVASAVAAEGIADLVRPQAFSVGLFPNLDGLLDGNLSGTLKWSPELSSSIDAKYLGSSEEATETSGTATAKAKTFEKKYVANATIVDFMASFGTAEGGLGLGAGISCAYSATIKSVSGYKSALGETTYFNKDSLAQVLTPSVDARAALAFGGAFAAELRGSFLPYAWMYETGSKLYSTYDEAIPYELSNACMGWGAGLDLKARFGTFGEFGVRGEAKGLYGDFGQVQDIVTGNIKTRISTKSAYAAYEGDLSIQYRLAFLREMLNIVPALGVGASYATESFDGVFSTSPIKWRFGLSFSSD